MDSHSTEEIDSGSYLIFKSSRIQKLKEEFPKLKEADLEIRLMQEWANMTEKEKLPYVKIVEDNPNMMDSACSLSSAHHKS